MSASRKLLAAVAAASLALLVVSVWVMAHRVDEYLRASDHRTFNFQRVDTRGFIFATRPVTIVDETTPGQGAGDQTVVVRYGDRELRVPATIVPASPRLPDLVRHRDWLQVFRFAERGHASIHEFESGIRTGHIRDRLAMVVRIPPPGNDRPAPGEVFRKDWSFDLYELRPDGGFDHERLAFPKGRRTQPGELVEGTWEFYAAMLTMPTLGKPSPKFTGDSLPAMGWTLPVAGFSGLLLTFTAALLFAPQRRVAEASRDA